MIAVALIRPLGNENYTYTLLEEERNHFKKVEYGRLEKYNMKDINIKIVPFKIPDEKYAEFIKILQSKEGQSIVNSLKNKKTNEIINEYLDIESKNYKFLDFSEESVNKRKKYTDLKEIILDLKREDLGGTHNALPRKLLCLTNEDIYKEFINVGLIKV